MIISLDEALKLDPDATQDADAIREMCDGLETMVRNLTNNNFQLIKFRTRAYRDWETDRKSTRLNSSHSAKSRMPSSA